MTLLKKTAKMQSIRPNQIYAVSLPHTMLTAEQALQVVNTVEESCLPAPAYAPSPNTKDYHGIYCGSLPKRDAAYHQGTAWGFLMGGFLTAYMKVHHHHSPEAKKTGNGISCTGTDPPFGRGLHWFYFRNFLTVMPRIPAVVAMPRHGALEKFCAATQDIQKKSKIMIFFLTRRSHSDIILNVPREIFN